MAGPVGALSRWPEVLHTGPVLRCPACRCRHLHVEFRNSFTFGFIISKQVLCRRAEYCSLLPYTRAMEICRTILLEF